MGKQSKQSALTSKENVDFRSANLRLKRKGSGISESRLGARGNFRRERLQRVIVYFFGLSFFWLVVLEAGDRKDLPNASPCTRAAQDSQMDFVDDFPHNMHTLFFLLCTPAPSMRLAWNQTF